MHRMGWLTLFALGSAPIHAQSPPPLFTQVSDASQPTPPRTVAAFPVGINFPGLADSSSLSIQLPGIGPLTATLARRELRSNGGYNWIGKTEFHDVVLSVDGELVTGFIRGGKDTFSILSDVVAPATSHMLLHMDAAAFPADLVLDAPLLKGATASQPERICFGHDYEPIDILLVYSPEALIDAGGDPGVMENSLVNAVAAANVTLGNSNIPTSFNIVGILPAPPTLVETGTAEDVENARQNAALIGLRRQLKADVVTYITSVGIGSQNRPFCGATMTQRRAGTSGYGYAFARMRSTL